MSNQNFLGAASAYWLISAIVSRKGVSGLVDLYASISAERLDLFSAVKKRYGWSDAQFEKEARRIVE